MALRPPQTSEGNPTNVRAVVAPVSVAGYDGTTLLMVPCLAGARKLPTEWPLTPSMVTALAAAFPAVDIPGEVRKAVLWMATGGSRHKKTYAGMPEFFRKWMTTAQDRAVAREATAAQRAQGGYQRPMNAAEHRQSEIAQKLDRARRDAALHALKGDK